MSFFKSPIFLPGRSPKAIISLSDTTLLLKETSTVTIKFSEAVKGFGMSDVITENGVLSKLTTNNHITWKAIFTPTAGVTDNSNHDSLLTGYTDIAGNTGKEASSANYTIETIAPTATISLSDTALLLKETSLVTIHFSEAVKAFGLSDLKAGKGYCPI